MRTPAIFLLILFSLAACSRYPSGTLVFVTNERDGTISVIETKTNKTVDTIVTGARPRGIRMSADGTRAFIALSSPIGKTPDPADSRILIVDTSNGNELGSIHVGDDPEQLALDAERVYVSNEDNGTATATDIASGDTLATLVTGIEPEGVIISPDGRWVYVMAETSSTVTVIDTEKLAVAQTFLVGTRPRDGAFSPDGRRAYISSELGGTLAVVDTGTHTVIDTVPIAYNDTMKPVGVLVSPAGDRVYVANGRGNSVSVIDASTFKLITTIPVGQRVWGIGLTPDGKTLYAANGLSNDVSVINTEGGRVVATIKAGDGPWGVAVRP